MWYTIHTLAGASLVVVAGLELGVVKESGWARGDVLIVARTQYVLRTVLRNRVQDVVRFTFT